MDHLRKVFKFEEPMKDIEYQQQQQQQHTNGDQSFTATIILSKNLQSLPMKLKFENKDDEAIWKQRACKLSEENLLSLIEVLTNTLRKIESLELESKEVDMNMTLSDFAKTNSITIYPAIGGLLLKIKTPLKQIEQFSRFVIRTYHEKGYLFPDIDDALNVPIEKDIKLFDDLMDRDYQTYLEYLKKLADLLLQEKTLRSMLNLTQKPISVALKTPLANLGIPQEILEEILPGTISCQNTGPYLREVHKTCGKLNYLLLNQGTTGQKCYVELVSEDYKDIQITPDDSDLISEDEQETETEILPKALEEDDYDIVVVDFPDEPQSPKIDLPQIAINLPTPNGKTQSPIILPRQIQTPKEILAFSIPSELSPSSQKLVKLVDLKVEVDIDDERYLDNVDAIQDLMKLGVESKFYESSEEFEGEISEIIFKQNIEKARNVFFSICKILIPEVISIRTDILSSTEDGQFILKEISNLEFAVEVDLDQIPANHYEDIQQLLKEQKQEKKMTLNEDIFQISYQEKEEAEKLYNQLILQFPPSNTPVKTNPCTFTELEKLFTISLDLLNIPKDKFEAIQQAMENGTKSRYVPKETIQRNGDGHLFSLTYKSKKDKAEELYQEILKILE